MKKLNERISTDTWKVIADKVQKLNIYDFSDEEFFDNLNMLRRMLSGLDISLDLLSRYPFNRNEIGLASLLQAIYDGNVYSDYKKANFYEKIYQLDELGIPSIQFSPVGFIDRVEGITLIKTSDTGEAIGVKKCFTDGRFDIGYPDEPFNRRFDLINLKDANYLINVLVELDRCTGKEILNLDGTYAILRNFNGVLPSKESITEIRYPGLCTYFKELDDGKRHLILKQIYYPFNTTDNKYSKRLVRTKDNYHYE